MVNFLVYILIGFVSVTLIDTIGATASRRMNFKYTYLAVVSFVVYVSVAYLAAKEYKLVTVLFINSIVGLYDGTIGLWLSIVLKANNGVSEEEEEEILGMSSAVTTIIVSIIFSLIGYGLAGV